jgi:hypothetical protein
MNATAQPGLKVSRLNCSHRGAAAGAAAVRARRVTARRRAGMAAAAVSPSQQPGAVALDPAAIDLAHRLADAAARVTTRYFR